MSARSPRIYLAGPDVFLRNAVEIGEAKKQICREHGCEGVFPLDADYGLEGLAPREAAFRISLGNEKLIRGCSAIIANLTPFRGISADVGTVYELGFAAALGLPLFA